MRIRRTHRYILRAREPASGVPIPLYLAALHISRMFSRDSGMLVPSMAACFLRCFLPAFEILSGTGVLHVQRYAPLKQPPRPCE